MNKNKSPFYVNSIILTFVSIIIFSTYSIAGEIPKNLMADNCNLVVQIYTTKPMTSSTEKSIIGFEGTTIKKIDPKALGIEMSEVIYNNIVALLNERFKSMGVSPKLFINMDAVTMSSTEKYKEANGLILKTQPKCMMILVLTDLSGAEKDIKKDQFTLASIKPASLTIVKMDGTSTETFTINKVNATVAKVVDELEKEIKSKPSGYFEKSDITTKDVYANTDVNDIDYLTKENKIVAGYPADLNVETILVLDQYSEIKMGGLDKMGKEMFGNFGEKYKYKYKVVGNADFTKEAKTGKYKYAMLLKFGAVYEKTKTKKSEGNFGNDEYKVSTTTTTTAFFMIKNLQTMDVYIGTDGELMGVQDSKPPVALKGFLKKLTEFYKW